MAQSCTLWDAERAWALLLQHGALCSDTSSICRLLLVSKQLQQVVHENLAGQLHVEVSAEQDGGGSKTGTALRQWLCAHGTLVKSLRYKQFSALECNRTEQQQQASQLAAGIIAASTAHPGRVLISSLSSNVCGKLLLQALPSLASSLTQLELGPFCTAELSKQLSTGPTPANTAVPAATPSAHPQASLLAATSAQPQCRTVLASLPHLSTLTLHGYVANSLLSTVQNCTQLTTLVLSNLLCSKVHLLHRLPVQLQELRVLVDPDFTSWQRKQRLPVLSHLTALTQLSCTGEGLFAVQADEVLPPSLVHLMVTDCPKAQPLLALSKLGVLVMQASTMAADQLHQLPAALPALHEVQLGYDRGNMEAITAAAPGWPALRGLIKGLDLRVYPGPLPAQTLSHIAQLGVGLTRLAISGFSVQVEATPAVFATVLSSLVGLKELKLAYLRLKEEPLPGFPAAAAAAGLGAVQQAGHAAPGPAERAGPSAAAAPAGPFDAVCPASSGLAVLMQTIAALPDLSSLSLHSMVLTGAPVAALTSATGLTALQLAECDLKECDVELLAKSLPGLRRLVLSWNFAITSAGLGCLSQLKGLKELFVCCGTTRHEAALAALQQQLPGLVTAS